MNQRCYGPALVRFSCAFLGLSSSLLSVTLGPSLFIQSAHADASLLNTGRLAPVNTSLDSQFENAFVPEGVNFLENNPGGLRWDPGQCTAPKGPQLQLIPGLQRFNYVNGYWLSWLSVQAYRGEEVAGLIRKVGLKDIDFINNKSTSFQAFVGSNEKFVVIGFAGTSDIKDFLTDMSFPNQPESFPGIPGRVHTGFKNVLDKSWNQLLDLIKKHSLIGKPIFLTGHSMGGASAVIAATRLASAGYPIDAIYTYSSPRIGDETYAQYVSQLFPSRIYRFVNSEEIVPRLPPPPEASSAFSGILPPSLRTSVIQMFKTMQYAHMGELIFQNASGTLEQPRAFSEEEDVSYWNRIAERSRGLSLIDLVISHWHLIYDHIPFTSHCRLKAPNADQPHQLH